MIKRIVKNIQKLWVRRSSDSILNYYRSIGIKIGEGTYAIHPRSLTIDSSRPSLIEIGNHVFLHRGISILNHDYTSWVFTELYDDFIPSHSRVKIGNNIWFGYNCTVLRGVTIGDNCIIALGSVVSKDIPANSVAGGVPAKVICTIEEYYEKRKRLYIEETIDYARSIKERFNREPNLDDFKDDYPCFVDGSNMDEYPMMPYSRVLKSHLERWKQKHRAPFKGFEEFMKEVNNQEKNKSLYK